MNAPPDSGSSSVQGPSDRPVIAHGGRLVNPMVDGSRREKLFEHALSLPFIILTDRQVCDLELLLNGGFSPLTGFMSRQAYDSVVESMRLPDGTVWTIPITLDLPSERVDPWRCVWNAVIYDAPQTLTTHYRH